MKDTKILLVDDDKDILEFLKYNLVKEGFEVEVASSGEEGLNLALKGRFDLIILDVMMPHMDGIEVCERLREVPEMSEVIILFLTARGEDYSQIAGFEAGADDYITKPIRPKVLISKIKATLRRNLKKSGKENTSSTGPFLVDRDKYLIIKNGKEISLPKKEFELAALLIAKPGSVFARENILNMVWGEEVVVGDRTIDVHMRKIREKLGKKYFKTIKGVGYKFVEK
ncbi:MAG: response regulator transcription factor [Vicingaceae bacterium]